MEINFSVALKKYVADKFYLQIMWILITVN